MKKSARRPDRKELREKKPAQEKGGVGKLNREDTQIDKIIGVTEKQMISQALQSLGDDLRNVLILRAGCGGTPALSVRETARRLDRPIQDIIEDEKKAIRLLRCPPTGRLFPEIVRRAHDAIWHALENADHVVYKKDKTRKKIVERLPGELLIAIKCTFENVRNWLNRNADQNRIAWYRSEYPKQVVIEAVKQLRELRGRFRFPVPLKRLAEHLKTEEPLLKLALALSRNRFEIYRGYVCEAHAGARSFRAVRIHLMFFYRYCERFLSVERIHAEYLDTYPDDNAIPRDIMLAIYDSPHLFLKIGSFEWCSIMTEAGPDPYRQKDASAMLREPDKDKAQFFYKKPGSEPSRLELAKEVCGRIGMARASEIEALLKEKYKDRLEEDTQITPLIAGSPDFIQVAPTVYCLREACGSTVLRSERIDMLLSRSDVRWYVISRYAGEPMNTFPLWTGEMEGKWCRWAEKRATNPSRSRLFQSLMYVADPDVWPVADDEKKRWQEIKKWNAEYYFLSDCKHRIQAKIPPVRDLLALSIRTSAIGGMSWVRANGTVGNYLFDQHSVTHLALLIALGVLEPTDHWQNPHKIGPTAGPFLKKLLDAFQIDPIGAWDSGSGLELRKQLSAIEENQDLGWVNREELALLSKKLDGEPVTESLPDAGASDPSLAFPGGQMALPF